MKAKPNSKAKSQVEIYQTIRKPMPPPSRVTKPSGKGYVRVKRVDPLFYVYEFEQHRYRTVYAEIKDGAAPFVHAILKSTAPAYVKIRISPNVDAR